MNELQIFTHDMFGNIRVVEKDGQPWFVVADVCRALKVGNPSDALNRLDEDEHTLVSIDGASNGLPVNAVNEPGLYSLTLGSRKPEAKPFKRWITHDVVPAIRKHGGYLTPKMIEEAILNPDVLINLATQLKEERARRITAETTIEEQKPLVEFANHVGDTTDLFTMAEFAKLSHDENIPLGRNKLYDWLRNKKYLRQNNEPYQQYVTQGIFKVKDVVKISPYGANVFPTTFVTGKGQIYLIEKLRAEFCNGEK